jgi:metal-responsive CopG/Arc/MetJ family transcriptional regulator
MRRTSLFIDEKLLAQLQRFARRQGVSFASVVREALAQYIAAPKTTALPSVAGRFTSGTNDASERVDELLWRDPHA